MYFLAKFKDLKLCGRCVVCNSFLASITSFSLSTLLCMFLVAFSHHTFRSRFYVNGESSATFDITCANIHDRHITLTRLAFFRQ